MRFESDLNRRMNTRDQPQTSPALLSTLRQGVWLLLLAGLGEKSFTTATAQELKIAAFETKSVSLTFPDTRGAWTRIEQSRDLRDWKIAAEPLFEVTSFHPHTDGQPARFYRFTQFPAPSPPYTVGVIGDSTAAGVIHGAEVISGGWAEGLKVHAGLDTRILNAGQAGLSSKSFLFGRQDRLNILTRTEPEFVLIQFGQIDEFSKPEEDKFTTIAEYRQNLFSIVELVRSWNGAPILVTPLPWRVFTEEGEISSTLRERSETMLEVARETGSFSVDLHQILAQHYQSISGEEIRAMSAVDQYHLSEAGAEIGAGLLVEALPVHLRSLLFNATD